MYAVNITDLCNTEAGKDIGVALLLNPVMDREHPIKTERNRFDGMGVCLNCDKDRAKAIVELIRKRYKRYRLRIYYSKTGMGGWKRV